MNVFFGAMNLGETFNGTLYDDVSVESQQSLCSLSQE